MKVSDYTYIFLDIEATLIRGKQHIIEIGAVKWLPDGTKDSISQLIKPSNFKKLNSHIQKLTGIKTEQILAASPFKSVMTRFMNWCKGETILVTFGEFDRKVLEEELIRNNMDVSFIYPIIDFQQKYMIANQLKDQPSLGGLLNTYEIEVEIQHRALADAYSLFKIFEATNGAQLIEYQKTNEFSLLLSEMRQMEEAFDLNIAYITANVSPNNISITSIQKLDKQLQFDILEEQREKEDGEIETIQRTQIHPNRDVEIFLKDIAKDLHNNKVLITRSGLKYLSRISRLHHCVIPKTEVMTLQLLLQDEERINEFALNDETNESFINKVQTLLTKNKDLIIEEFKIRDLLIREEVLI